MKTYANQHTMLKKKCQHLTAKEKIFSHPAPHSRQVNGEEISIFKALERYMLKYSL